MSGNTGARVVASGLCMWLLSACLAVAAEPVKYARFRVEDRAAYGIVEGDQVRELSGSLFADWKKTDKLHKLSDVRLLVPTVPRQVLALAGNYKSHLKDEIPEQFRIPQPFVKGTACLVPDGAAIVLPDAPGEVHYEAELVIVIGKKARKVGKDEAKDYILGVTCGNDVSQRYWQNDPKHKDVQWWRAKGSDTFGPVGPYITSGIDYDDLLLKLKLNGEVKQEERTSRMIHSVPAIVSFISQYTTLYPGDLIFTGTSGTTSAMKPGDVVEIELEGVGTLRNRVVAEK